MTTLEKILTRLFIEAFRESVKRRHYAGESWLLPGREMAPCVYVLTPIYHSFGSVIRDRFADRYLLEKGESKNE